MQGLGVHSKGSGEPLKSFKSFNAIIQFTFHIVTLERGGAKQWGDYLHAVPIVQASNNEGLDEDGHRQDGEMQMDLRCI